MKQLKEMAEDYLGKLEKITNEDYPYVINREINRLVIEDYKRTEYFHCLVLENGVVLTYFTTIPEYIPEGYVDPKRGGDLTRDRYIYNIDREGSKYNPITLCSFRWAFLHVADFAAAALQRIGKDPVHFPNLDEDWMRIYRYENLLYYTDPSPFARPYYENEYGERFYAQDHSLKHAIFKKYSKHTDWSIDDYMSERGVGITRRNLFFSAIKDSSGKILRRPGNEIFQMVYSSEQDKFVYAKDNCPPRYIKKFYYPVPYSW